MRSCQDFVIGHGLESLPTKDDESLSRLEFYRSFVDLGDPSSILYRLASIFSLLYSLFTLLSSIFYLLSSFFNLLSS